VSGPRVLVLTSSLGLGRGGQSLTALNIVVQLARAGAQMELATGLAPDDPRLDELKAEGVKLHAPARGPIGQMEYARFARGVVRSMTKRGEVEIVQVHAPQTAQVARLGMLWNKAKLVQVVHGLWKDDLPENAGPLRRWSQRFMERRIAGKTDLFVSLLNHDYYDPHLLALGVPGEKILDVPIGPPVSRFAGPPPEEPAEVKALLSGDAGPYVVFVGRLAPDKGQRHLIQAMADVRKTHPDARAVFVGSGPNQEECKALAGRLGIGKACMFVGERRDPTPFLGGAAAVVTHISGRVQGIGTAHREAVFLNRPLIAGDQLDLRKTFGESVHLVPPADPNALAAEICAILDDPVGSAAKVKEARARLDEEYSWARFSELVLEAYQRLVGL